MPNIIRIKRRVTGAAGAPTGLKSAELAYNMADNTIYAGFGDDGSGNATAVKPIGGEGTFAKIDSPALTGTPTAPTPAGADNSTKLATTAFIKGLGYLTTNNTITISGDASGSGTTAIALTLASVGTAGDGGMQNSSGRWLWYSNNSDWYPLPLFGCFPDPRHRLHVRHRGDGGLWRRCEDHPACRHRAHAGIGGAGIVPRRSRGCRH